MASKFKIKVKSDKNGLVKFRIQCKPLPPKTIPLIVKSLSVASQNA